MDSMLLQMKDMPPNPEDGELYLPPYIVKEINSGIIHPKKKNQLCYAAVVAGYGGVKAQPIVNSLHKPSANIQSNNQGCEKKAEQVVPMEQKLTWAQIVKREVNSPHKNNMCVPPQPSSSMSSKEPQKVKGKIITPNKQVTRPKPTKKISGKKK